MYPSIFDVFITCMTSLEVRRAGAMPTETYSR